MAWIDTNANNFEIQQQNESQSCGMACLVMVMELTGNGRPTEKAVAATSSEHGGKYISAVTDRPSFKNAPRMLTATNAVTLNSYEGTDITNLAAVLNSYQINTSNVAPAHSVGQAPSASLEATWGLVEDAKPAIAHVSWTGGGGHFVVVAKYKAKTGLFKKSKKTLTVYDPSYGLVYQDVSSTNPYAPQQGLAGSFSGWVVLVT